MKNQLLFIALAVLLLDGCTKMDPENSNVTEEYYIGTVSVLYEGETVDNENIKVKFSQSNDGTTASIVIYRIRFVPKMPVRINVTIPDITIQAEGSNTAFSCDRVVPLALGGEYPKYTVTDLHGEIVGDRLQFSLNFGEYPTSFSGVFNK